MWASLSNIWGLDATHFTAHMHLYSISCTCASQLLHITLSPHHLNQTSLQVLAPLKNPFFGRPGKHAAFTPKHALITPKHAAMWNPENWGKAPSNMFSLSTCLAGRPKLSKEKKPWRNKMSVEEENRQVHSRACGVGRRPRPRKVGSSWAMRAMKIWSRFILCIPLLTLEKAFWGITPQFVNHAAITKNLFFPEWHQNFCRKDSLGIDRTKWWPKNKKGSDPNDWRSIEASYEHFASIQYYD